MADIYDKTLSQLLSDAGIEHRKDRATEYDGRRSWYNPRGSFIGRYTVFEGFELMLDPQRRPDGEKYATDDGSRRSRGW